MRVIINGSEIYDLNDQKSFAVLLFETDEERKTVARHLSNMPDIDKQRAYGIFPEQLTGDEMDNLMFKSVSLACPDLDIATEFEGRALE